MEKNAGRSPRLVLVRAPTRRAGKRWAVEALYGREGRGRVAAAWTDGRGAAEGGDAALVGLRRRLSGKRAFTRPPAQRPCRSTTHLPGPASSPRSTTPT